MGIKLVIDSVDKYIDYILNNEGKLDNQDNQEIKFEPNLIGLLCIT